MSEISDSTNNFGQQRAGGAAASAGILFEQQLGALIGTWILSGRPLDERLNLGSAAPVWMRFETEAPVDDILVGTSDGGYIAIQAKTTVSLSSDLKSPFGKTISQFVQYWLVCRNGDGDRGWNRPLDPERDRLVLAVGTKTAMSIQRDLPAALSLKTQAGGGTLTAAQAHAWQEFSICVSKAWSLLTNEPLEPHLSEQLAKLVIVFVFEPVGTEQAIALAGIAPLLSKSTNSKSALNALQSVSSHLMAQRGGADLVTLRRLLMANGVQLSIAPRYQADIARLIDHSATIAQSLNRYEFIDVTGHSPITIVRECQAYIQDAAMGGSLLIIGEPGAGKSGVLNALARSLQETGKDVVQLAVDHHSVETLEGLKNDLRLDHSLLEVLNAWDGPEPGWLIIDALDASRGGVGEAVFRSLIERVLDGGSRWRIVASIRTFDLRMGQKFRSLFKGAPPVHSLHEPEFSMVRHVRVPAWSPTEFQQLLSRAPILAAALEAAPKRLFDLAAIPFNTRLLSELIKDGVLKTTLTHVSSQVELLQLYWSHRVTSHGTPAQLCIRRIVETMVATRALRVQFHLAAGDRPEAIDQLSREGVIVAVDNGRWIQFRHHILFDFAASRVLLDPTSLASGKQRLDKKDGHGLMLAPALTFVMREIWERGADRTAFWSAAIQILKDLETDPVIRSVTSRICVEYPEIETDTRDFAMRICNGEDGANTAFFHVGGALAVRLEDRSETPIDAWTAFLAAIANSIGQVANTVRFLLFKFIPIGSSPKQRNDLGFVARALLESNYNENPFFVPAAIDFVSETFSSDPECSRLLLARVFEEQRLQTYGSEEVPAICRNIKAIADNDPEFAAEIYRLTYRFTISDERQTRMGHSRILSLTSTAKQDYDMARYDLSEFCLEFLNTHPKAAVDAIIDAFSSYVTREHTLSPGHKSYVVDVAQRSARLQEDWSHIWAHDSDDTYAEDGQALIKKLVEYLRNAEASMAVLVANRLIDRNALALLWSRLFMVSAERSDALLDLVLPFAMTKEFLLLPDTTKDAIDVISRGYGRLSNKQRSIFEQQALAFDFIDYSRPGEARNHFLNRLFHTIKRELLASDAARALAQGEASPGEESNERLFVIRSSHEAAEEYHWIEGLDRSAEANIDIMAAISQIKMWTEGGGLDVTLEELLARLEAFVKAAEGSSVNQDLAIHGEGVVAQALAKIIVEQKVLKEWQNSSVAQSAVRLLQRVAISKGPEVDEETESQFEQGTSWGSPAARVEASQAILDLVLQVPETYNELSPTIDALLGDRHPAVRLQAGLRLVRIWDVDRDGFWRRLKTRLHVEENLGVLDLLMSGVLGRVLHAEPEKAERMIIALLSRHFGDAVRQARVRVALSDEITILWITHRRPAAKAVLDGWIADTGSYHRELAIVLSTMREAFVAGLVGKVERGDNDLRKRSHDLAGSIVEAAAKNLEAYFLRAELSPDETRDANEQARLIDAACREIYFSSGARRDTADTSQIRRDDLRVFFQEIAPILRRIGECGTPRTIHHLLQLLEFLLPLDPALAFELLAGALRGGGKRTGYQFETMGADLFAKLIGIFLADHKQLFGLDDRRAALAECLEIFMDAGWPAARRLLYRLPELVQ